MLVLLLILFVKTVFGGKTKPQMCAQTHNSPTVALQTGQQSWCLALVTNAHFFLYVQTAGRLAMR